MGAKIQGKSLEEFLKEIVKKADEIIRLLKQAK